MKSMLLDLGRHLSWADAEFWRAFEQSDAVNDDVIRRRLHHIHIVQYAFHWFVSGNDPIQIEKQLPHYPASLEALREFGAAASRRLSEFIGDVSAARLNERIPFPWFDKSPPLSLTVAEALMQAVMHSQWHRGQNAARLRELGTAPPALDLIIWYVKDRPAAAW